MAKFIKGPFSTIGEVQDAIRALEAEGYNRTSITIVANREDDLRALEQETPVDVKQEDAQMLVNDEERPFWEQMTDAFTGYFFNQDYKDNYDHTGEYKGEDDDPRQMLAGYRGDLEDGKIVLLVEDILDSESKLNLDAVDNLDHRKEDRDESHEVRDANPAEVMDDLPTERDSHPDIDENEAVLNQETTYVPSESLDTYGVQDATKKYRAVPNETDVTPIFDDPRDTYPQDVPAPGEEDGPVFADLDDDKKGVDMGAPENLPEDSATERMDDTTDTYQDNLVVTPHNEPDAIPTDVTAVETNFDPMASVRDDSEETFHDEEFDVVHDDHHNPADVPEDGVLIDEAEGTAYIDGEKGTTGDPDIRILDDKDDLTRR